MVALGGLVQGLSSRLQVRHSRCSCQGEPSSKEIGGRPLLGTLVSHRKQGGFHIVPCLGLGGLAPAQVPGVVQAHIPEKRHPRRRSVVGHIVTIQCLTSRQRLKP